MNDDDRFSFFFFQWKDRRRFVSLRSRVVLSFSSSAVARSLCFVDVLDSERKTESKGRKCKKKRAFSFLLFEATEATKKVSKFPFRFRVQQKTRPSEVQKKFSPPPSSFNTSLRTGRKSSNEPRAALCG